MGLWYCQTTSGLPLPRPASLHTQAWVSVNSKHRRGKKPLLLATSPGNGPIASVESGKSVSPVQLDKWFALLEEPGEPASQHQEKDGAVPTDCIPLLALITDLILPLCHLTWVWSLPPCLSRLDNPDRYGLGLSAALTKRHNDAPNTRMPCLKNRPDAAVNNNFLYFETKPPEIADKNSSYAFKIKSSCF